MSYFQSEPKYKSTSWPVCAGILRRLRFSLRLRRYLVAILMKQFSGELFGVQNNYTERLSFWFSIFMCVLPVLWVEHEIHQRSYKCSRNKNDLYVLCKQSEKGL